MGVKPLRLRLRHLATCDGEAVIVALEAPEKSFERYLDAMQPVVDSVRFEDYR